MKPGQIQYRRGIYLTHDLDIGGNLTLKICSLMNCVPKYATQSIKKGKVCWENIYIYNVKSIGNGKMVL